MNDQNPEVKQGKCGCGNTLFVKKDNRWFCGECVIAYEDATKMLEEMAVALETAKEFALSVNQTSVSGSEKHLWSEDCLPVFITTLDIYRKWKSDK